jgi:hypothetical protein
MGSDKQALCKDSTLLDRVAEKRNVILSGNVFRILSTIGPNQGPVPYQPHPRLDISDLEVKTPWCSPDGQASALV